MVVHLDTIVYIVFICLLFDKGKATIVQDELDYIANALTVNVKVVDNLDFDGAKHLFHVKFYNSGNNVIQGSDWTIYFYSFFMIEPDYLPADSGVIIDSEGIRLKHVQGCLFSLEPVDGFGIIKPKNVRSLKFFGQNWAVSKSDIPPNWYIVAPSLKPRVIKSTQLSNPDFVSNFILPKQWKRNRADVYNPFTPEERYNRYKIEDMGKPGKPIIPTPKEIRVDEASYLLLDPSWRIRSEIDFIKEAQYLSDKTHVPLEENINPDNSAKIISITANATMDLEEYYLYVNPASDSVVIKGKTSAGVFYGIQSLLSLLAGSTDRRLFETEVRDNPRFGYRGMYVDVARNFHGKEDIMRLLDVMAMYKMNKLHLHLSDDEGWRVEIADLPELTNIASKRCHDLNEDKCLIPQLGSGPDESSSGSGFYTRVDYIDIVKYANDRHIEVIPEVDMPGHARAAIKAMEARFRHLSSEESAEADKYRLIDPNDASSYHSVQMFNDNAINPCIESTYNFIEKIVDDLKNMHKTAGQPLNKYHFGGDEVSPGAWKNTTACTFLGGNIKSRKDRIKQYFAQRVANLTKQKGLNLVGWEDGLMDKNNSPYKRILLPNTEVLANAWDNVWEWGAAKRAYALANQDYKVILSHVTHLYFDHPYEPDPEERGLYWGTRFTDTYKAFGYNADDLYKNIDVKRSGEPITKQDVCGPDNSGCPVLHKPENIIAERGWHKSSWETDEDTESRSNETFRDWQLFANSLGYKELRRLEQIDVNYRVSPPGAISAAGKLKVFTEFPNLSVEYSSNYGQTWQSVPENYEPNDNLLLRTKSINGIRSSREIKFTLPTDQLLLDYIGANLDIKYDVVDNLVNGSASFMQKIVLRNQGSQIIRSGTWSIYFYHIRLVEPFNYPYPDGYLIEHSGMRIFHVAGSLYRLATDMDTFKSMKPNEQLILQFRAKYWQSARTDNMPNWYVTADGLEPRVIESTEGESLNFIGPFDTVNKWKRFPGDKYDPYLPRTRYVINDKVSDLGKPGKHIIPTPYMMAIDDQTTVSITREDWVIVQSDDFPNEVEFLIGKTSLAKVSQGPASKYISFVKDVVSIAGKASSDEAYKLLIDPELKTVTITAHDSAGAFYGVQSLLRLSTKIQNGIEVSKAEVEDQPRFGYRGMHLDVGRNFHSLDEIKLLLNTMAMYKLNKFHFHLTEDEGWRIQIPGLEELTEVGSKRCHDLNEETCIVPQLGSGPNADSSGTGYYTVDQYKEILREARRLHIEVIPEFDMPGHARAAIKSMEHRFNKYKAMGNMTAANEYLLSEFGDPSEYLTVQWFNDNAINVCLESSYNFIRHLMKTMKMLHENIQPLTIFHFGGDEVAHGAWLNSSACQSLINQSSNLKSISDLKEYFARRVASLGKSEGLDIAAWEDGLMKTKTDPFDKTSLVQPPRNAYAYSWRNLFEYGSGDHAYVLANAGYKVVLVHATHLYFDHPYEPDPEERGYYWATRYTDTYKTFSYIPDDIYANAHLTISGDEMTPEQICKSECLTLEKPQNIIGIQGALWSETSRTSEHLHSMLFPRILALGERAWHKSGWENITNREERNKLITKEWEDFANSLGYKDLHLLDSMDIKYRVPPPGAIIESNKLQVNSQFPGLDIEYSIDNGTTWKSAKGDPLIEKTFTIKLRTRSADKTRASRVITLPQTPSHVLSSASCLHKRFPLFVTLFLFCVFKIM